MPAEHRKSDCSSLNWDGFFGKSLPCFSFLFAEVVVVNIIIRLKVSSCIQKYVCAPVRLTSSPECFDATSYYHLSAIDIQSG